MMKKSKMLMLLVCTILIFAFPLNAFAADTVVDFSKQGSIGLTLKDSAGEHSTVYGASFKLYKVASAIGENNNLRFNFTSDFAASGVSLDNLSAEGLAAHLAAYAQEKQISSVTRNGDTAGKVSFPNLDLGLYLLVQNGTVENYYGSTPFLVSVPMTNEDGTGWVYDIEASPKVEAKPVTPAKTKEMTVKKAWVDSGSDKPASVTAVLSRDGAVYEKIELNAKNNWTHTWINLDTNYTWNISELEVPAGYKVTYSTSGTVTTITNTGSAAETAKKPAMIQTGQLNWPIPLLSGVGLLLLFVGSLLLFDKRKKKNEA